MRQPGASERCSGFSADRTYVRSLRALGALAELELDLLVLLEVLVPLTRDRAEVHEHVGTVLLGDEAETLLRAEPLHGASCHCNSLLPRPARASDLPAGLRLDRRSRELRCHCMPNPR